MAYIGNQVSSVPFIIDTFSGTGSATTFGQLTRAPAGVASIAVFVAGVYKTPGVDYTLNGDMITFTSAPAAGTNNIVIHHMGNGSATQIPSDGSVTGAKLAANTVRGNNIVAGTITGNQIGAGAISGNQLGAYSVSGNNIGTGAISANNFAGGGITSNVLSSNLQISTTRVSETINVITTSISGNYNVHVGNTTVYHFLANSAGNTTFNFVANNGTATGTTGRINDLIVIGQSVSAAMLFKQGQTRYRANVYVDGALQTCYWAGNTQPQYQEFQSMSYDAYNFSIIKIADNRYTVFASNTQFGQANGQGMGTVTAPFGQGQ
jgi:hypothetical protein